MSVPRALTIATSDSGGGAGVQADIKAFAATGCHGMSALVALTAQNTVGVTAVQELPADFVLAQLEAVWDDVGVDAAKTGMLFSRRAIETVAGFLESHTAPLVVDPVMVASSGAQLLQDDAVVCVKGRLDTREDAPKLVCLEVTCVELASDGAVPLHLAVPPHRLDERCVEELKRVLVEHPGDSPVLLRLGTTELRLPPTFNVDTTNGLLGELRVLLGPACIQG